MSDARAAVAGWAVALAVVAGAAVAAPDVDCGSDCDAVPGLSEMRGLAARMIAAGRFDDAIAVFGEITLHIPDDPRAHYDLASTLGFVRRYVDAVGPARRTVELDPDNPVVHTMAASIYANAGHPEQAFESTLAAARLGETTAMFELVFLYQDGIGVEADPDSALDWARRAAEAGHGASMQHLARVYREGLYGQDVDPERADHWTERASKLW